MIKLEEIVRIITTDLKLNLSEQDEFDNQFMQLFVYNLLLEIPDQYKEVINNIDDEVLKSRELLIKKIESFGITNAQSRDLIDNSIRKSISEVVESYRDVLTTETKERLQNYI